MNFSLSEEQQEFLDRLRAYLDGLAGTEEVVADWERDFTLITGPSREFLRRLGRDGWLGVGWPKEYGGQGRSAVEQWLFLEEMAYRRLPSGNLTVSSIGPVIAHFGTEEQKREYLPGILAAELEFAIGYTEPDAGTDLANLQTRAEQRADGFWTVNGQKVFTTGASIATHLWLAARTGPADSRHRGISLFIVPMTTPGITVRPLWTQSGERTNEVFLDDVVVDPSGLVGDVNGGWACITHQLDLERLFAVGLLRRQFERIVGWQAEQDGGAVGDPWARSHLAALGAEVEMARLLNVRAAWMIDSGRTPYAEASMAKVWFSELRQRLALEALDLMGPAGQLQWHEPDAPDDGYFEHAYRESTVFKFGAGTNEVQRTIIAQQALGLPR
ncbi:MAG TPA: acyl-CoA dehydrogenase family protein [Acidimicrobiia bacterium]|nr:acyl-CoA dehydrogenase family protein [Acidimicrobiia bacterium]